MLSANAFNLDQSKILPSGYELVLDDTGLFFTPMFHQGQSNF